MKGHCALAKLDAQGYHPLATGTSSSCVPFTTALHAACFTTNFEHRLRKGDSNTTMFTTSAQLAPCPAETRSEHPGDVIEWKIAVDIVQIGRKGQNI